MHFFNPVHDYLACSYSLIHLGHSSSTWVPKPARPYRENNYVAADGHWEAHWHHSHRISCNGSTCFCLWPILCTPLLFVLCHRFNKAWPGILLCTVWICESAYSKYSTTPYLQVSVFSFMCVTGVNAPHYQVEQWIFITFLFNTLAYMHITMYQTLY